MTESQTQLEGGPAIEMRRVPKRKYLTEEQVMRLAAFARAGNRWAWRDATMILMAYRHGLRVSELVSLCWHDIDLDAQTIFIRRAKGSVSGEHPLTGDECRSLRRVSPTGRIGVFMSEGWRDH